MISKRRIHLSAETHPVAIDHSQRAPIPINHVEIPGQKSTFNTAELLLAVKKADCDDATRDVKTHSNICVGFLNTNQTYSRNKS